MLASLSHGQTDPPQAMRNNAFLEVAGNGGLYSINYERIVVDHFTLRLGFATWNLGDDLGGGKTGIVTLPVLANLLLGRKKSKLEVGVGFLFGREKSNNQRSSIFDLTGVIGYRYQPRNGGFMFRVGITPFYVLNGADDPYPGAGLTLSGGLSVGYNF
jgi:hypothetical protein